MCIRDRQYPDLDDYGIACEVARKKRFNPRRLKSAEELKGEIDLAAEKYRFVRVVRRGSGEEARLRLFDDRDRHPSETEVSAALKKMLVPPVKVGALAGHYERSVSKGGDRDYSIFATRGRFRYSMINQGFDVVELNLAEAGDVPDEIGILLVADPRTPLTEAETAAVDRLSLIHI